MAPKFVSYLASLTCRRIVLEFRLVSGHSSMVEYRLPMPVVVGSSPIARSIFFRP
jgi:hypothetical protein